MPEGHIKSTIKEKGILEIEFFHPKHNSLPSNLLRQLTETIDDASENAKVEVVILRSGGNRTFCAGASFDELISINDFDTGKAFFMGFANVINACRKCSKIIIGLVQGKAVGGGVGLASAVDYCLATKYAAIKLSELNIGIGPFVIEPAVSRKVGLSAFSQMALDANTFFSPAWAMNKGLYANVFESAEEMEEAGLTLARYLVNTNPTARTKLKQVFWKGTEHWEELLSERAANSGKLVLSKFTKAALARH